MTVWRYRLTILLVKYIKFTTTCKIQLQWLRTVIYQRLHTQFLYRYSTQHDLSLSYDMTCEITTILPDKSMKSAFHRKRTIHSGIPLPNKNQKGSLKQRAHAHKQANFLSLIVKTPCARTLPLSTSLYGSIVTASFSPTPPPLPPKTHLTFKVT